MKRSLYLAVLTLLLISCRPFDPKEPPEVAVRVGYVALDPRAGAPVMVLQDENGHRSLPIWIGFSEAHSIASEMEERPLPRPNSHDLAKRVIVGLKGQVDRVVVTELKEGTYYALLVLEAGGRNVEIDSRPSDAIALALRFEAPVYVREALFRVVEELPGIEGPSGQRAEALDRLWTQAGGRPPAAWAGGGSIPLRNLNAVAFSPR